MVHYVNVKLLNCPTVKPLWWFRARANNINVRAIEKADKCDMGVDKKRVCQMVLTHSCHPL